MSVVALVLFRNRTGIQWMSGKSLLTDGINTVARSLVSVRRVSSMLLAPVFWAGAQHRQSSGQEGAWTAADLGPSDSGACALWDLCANCRGSQSSGQ